MISLRLRTIIPEAEMEQKVGKIVTADDFNALVTRDAEIRKPDGSLLCVYKRRALPVTMTEEAYPVLHSLKKSTSENRGLASGMDPAKHRYFSGTRRSTAEPVRSAIIGSFDKSAQRPFCRLTAWTGRQTEEFKALWPMLQEISGQFAQLVPDRYAKQMAVVGETPPEWVIPGTPFTTVTVNNTYPTGVHMDKGDLDEGFSTLACLRRGAYHGGALVFPRYRVAVDMKDGDLLLMDAHEWHGNTLIEPESEDAERISVVSYFRTKMAECGSFADESEKARFLSDDKLAIAAGE